VQTMTGTEKEAATVPSSTPGTTVNVHPPSSGSSTSTPDGTFTGGDFKTLCKAVEDLAKVVAEIKAGPQPVQAAKVQKPAGDIPRNNVPVIDPIGQALTEGNLSKALKLVDNDTGRLYGEMDRLVKKSLSDSGIGVDKYFIASYQPSPQ
jgi:hypothetical protein